MRIRARAAASILAAGAILTLPLSPASATAAAAPPYCQPFAEQPIPNSTAHVIWGTGGRGYQCSTSSRVMVYVMKYNRFWFDKELAQAEVTGTNVQATAKYTCSGTGHQEVYTRTVVGDREVLSPNVYAVYCG
jgi:hypothetical protein